MKLKMTVTFDPFTVDATKLMEAIKGCGLAATDIDTHPAREVKATSKNKPAKVEAVK